MELTVSECVLRSVTMLVGAMDTIGGCDLETARNSVLLLCPMAAGSCGELAVGERVGDFGGCKSVLFWLGGLA